ncbi:MAG: pantoate--beta-alanine ligase [Gammaproteobacteria bacterium]|nr:pantoate--beta-alanine ligase [Gammaproteobacteria bacterium]MDH5801083.1 pantoate--beta-alanine ligase [Gammaproteobacteria bacterium]
MQLITDVQTLHVMVRDMKAHNHTVACVPTMGNLHEGHLELVRQAKKAGHKVVVSIFVNPLQFAPGTDFESYPRTLEQDQNLLTQHDVNFLFAPDVREIYPGDLAQVTKVVVPNLSDILCGEFRPDHFAGVTTVVAKLFHLVEPDVAYFGEKDFQQLTIIRRMVKDLCFPIDIHGVPTVRESNGLALSSRNQYLSPQQKQTAAVIYQMLSHIQEQLSQGSRNYETLEKEGMQRLNDAGLKPEYVSIRQQEDLGLPDTQSTDLVVLAAAWLGPARLIDNVKLSLL